MLNDRILEGHARTQKHGHRGVGAGGARDGIREPRIQDTIPVNTHGVYHSVVAINAASIVTPHFVDAPVRPEQPPTEHRDRPRAIIPSPSCRQSLPLQPIFARAVRRSIIQSLSGSWDQNEKTALNEHGSNIMKLRRCNTFSIANECVHFKL